MDNYLGTFYFLFYQLCQLYGQAFVSSIFGLSPAYLSIMNVQLGYFFKFINTTYPQNIQSALFENYHLIYFYDFLTPKEKSDDILNLKGKFYEFHIPSLMLIDESKLLLFLIFILFFSFLIFIIMSCQKTDYQRSLVLKALELGYWFKKIFLWRLIIYFYLMYSVQISLDCWRNIIISTASTSINGTWNYSLGLVLKFIQFLIGIAFMSFLITKAKNISIKQSEQQQIIQKSLFINEKLEQIKCIYDFCSLKKSYYMFYPFIVLIRNEVLTIVIVAFYDSPRNLILIITCIIGFQLLFQIIINPFKNFFIRVLEIGNNLFLLLILNFALYLNLLKSHEIKQSYDVGQILLGIYFSFNIFNITILCFVIITKIHHMAFKNRFELGQLKLRNNSFQNLSTEKFKNFEAF